MYEKYVFNLFFILRKFFNQKYKKKMNKSNRGVDYNRRSEAGNIRPYNEELGKCERAFRLGKKAGTVSKWLFLGGIAVYLFGVGCNIYCDKKYREYLKDRNYYNFD
jgi:hypothetical protein